MNFGSRTMTHDSEEWRWLWIEGRLCVCVGARRDEGRNENTFRSTPMVPKPGGQDPLEPDCRSSSVHSLQPDTLHGHFNMTPIYARFYSHTIIINIADITAPLLWDYSSTRSDSAPLQCEALTSAHPSWLHWRTDSSQRWWIDLKMIFLKG